MALPTPTTEEHDTSPRNIVANFLKLCHDPLHDLRGWLDSHERARGAGDRLPAQPRTRLGGNGGLRQVRGQGNAAQVKLFRHAAKITNARMGDFNRSLMPFLARVARAVVRDAARQTTERPPPEAGSADAEIAAILSRFGAAIDAVQRLDKPRHEIEALIRALREQQQKDVAAARKRRKTGREANPKGFDGL